MFVGQIPCDLMYLDVSYLFCMNSGHLLHVHLGQVPKSTSRILHCSGNSQGRGIPKCIHIAPNIRSTWMHTMKMPASFKDGQ